MKTVLTMVACIFMHATTLYAAVPNWTRAVPAFDGQYIYFVGIADGPISAATEKAAYADAVKQLLLKIGGTIVYKTRLLRSEELTIGESDLRFKTDVAVNGIEKIEVHAEPQTTWVLIGIPSAVFWAEMEKNEQARALRPDLFIFIADKNQSFNAYLEKVLLRTFSVTKDTLQADYLIDYCVESMLFAQLGKEVAYRVTITVKLLLQNQIIDVQEFVEIGSGWNQAEAEAVAFKFIAIDAASFIRNNIK